MKWPWQNDSKQLNRIERLEEQILSSIGDLDAALTTLGEHVSALKTAVEALIAAIPPGSFASEIQQVQDALANVDATATEVANATPPPPPPPGG